MKSSQLTNYTVSLILLLGHFGLHPFILLSSAIYYATGKLVSVINLKTQQEAHYSQTKLTWDVLIYTIFQYIHITLDFLPLSLLICHFWNCCSLEGFWVSSLINSNKSGSFWNRLAGVCTLTLHNILRLCDLPRGVELLGVPLSSSSPWRLPCSRSGISLPLISLQGFQCSSFFTSFSLLLFKLPGVLKKHSKLLWLPFLPQ